MQTLLPTMII